MRLSSPGGCGCDGGGTSHYPLALPNNDLLCTNSYVDPVEYWLSDEDDVSVIEPKTPDNTDAHGAKEQRQSTRSAGDQVATGSRPLAIGPTAEATPAGVTGLGPVAADGSTVGGPGGK